MQFPAPADERLAAIAKIAASRSDSALVLRHLNDLVRSTALQGSHRSGQFLAYIVKQALAGHFGSLKERVIGVELFGRDPSYDNLLMSTEWRAQIGHSRNFNTIPMRQE